MEDLQVASKEKCPLCGGDVLLGECSSCGYAVPDTEKLSAVYDLSPDNVVFGDAVFDYDEDDIPSIEIPDASALPTAEQRRQAARLKRAQAKAAAEAAKKSPALNMANTSFVPYTKPNYGNQQKPVNSADTLDLPTKMVKSVSDFVFNNWWKFLLTAILPSVGYGFAFFYFVINMDKDRKKSELFFAAAILLTTILLQAVKWDPTGFDILIQYFIKGFLTRGRHYY